MATTDRNWNEEAALYKLRQLGRKYPALLRAVAQGYFEGRDAYIRRLAQVVLTER